MWVKFPAYYLFHVSSSKSYIPSGSKFSTVRLNVFSSAQKKFCEDQMIKHKN